MPSALVITAPNAIASIDSRTVVAWANQLNVIGEGISEMAQKKPTMPQPRVFNVSRMKVPNPYRVLHAAWNHRYSDMVYV
jgi:hypothetical protein